MSTTPEPDVLADLIARCPEHGTRTESWPECRCAAARQAADVLAAESGVQPDTRPEAYGDGKGRAYCLRCAHHVGASVPLTANDVDAHELCPSCGRHVVDVAQETEPARPVPDTEREDRYAQAIRNSNGLPEALAWWQQHPQLIPAHVYGAASAAVADEEQRVIRAELHEVRTLAARRESKLIGLRAELEKARDLLQRAESYLSALHGSVARHDNLGAGLGCAGCELRDQIAALRTTAARSVGQAEDGAQQK